MTFLRGLSLDGGGPARTPGAAGPALRDQIGTWPCAPPGGVFSPAAARGAFFIVFSLYFAAWRPIIEAETRDWSSGLKFLAPRDRFIGKTALSRRKAERGPKMKADLEQQELEQFRSLAGEVLANPLVRGMSAYIQHGQTSCLAHSVAVAWYSFVVYKRLGLHGQERALVRGALLHDFFLYDWHEPGHPRLHGFTHPGAAARNAVRYFGISGLEEDIIRKHMWPLTVIPPLHRAALIVSLVDKVCTVAEVFGHSYRPLLTACRV